MNEKIEQETPAEDEYLITKNEAHTHWVSHYVVRVELVNPIQVGLHKRSYVRSNIASDEFDTSKGVLTLHNSSGHTVCIPMENIVLWKTIYIHVPDFDEGDKWRYEPCEGSIQIDDPVGYYYRTGIGDATECIGWLYEDRSISKMPK